MKNLLLIVSLGTALFAHACNPASGSQNDGNVSIDSTQMEEKHTLPDITPTDTSLANVPTEKEDVPSSEVDNTKNSNPNSGNHIHTHEGPDQHRLDSIKKAKTQGKFN